MEIEILIYLKTRQLIQYNLLQLILYLFTYAVLQTLNYKT